MAGTKVNVKTVWGKKEKKSSIKINATTLGGALEELLKLPEWGEFDGKLDVDHKANSKGHVTEVTLKPSYTILMPTWAGYGKATKTCRGEWDRMWKKLDEHENGHRLIHLEALAAIQSHLQMQTDLTVEQFEADLARMMEDGQSKQEKFDAATGHGSKKGVELNITKDCQ